MPDSVDGDIRLKVTFDTQEVSDAQKSLQGSFADYGRKVANSFSSGEKAADKFASKLAKTNESITKQSNALADQKRKYDAIISGETTPASVKSMESELKRTQKEIEAITNKGKQTSVEFENWEKSAEKLNVELAKATAGREKQASVLEDQKRKYEAVLSGEATPASVKKMETEFQRTQKEIESTKKEAAELEQQLDKLQKRADYRKAVTGTVPPDLQAEINRLDTQMEPFAHKIRDAEEKANRLGEALEKVKLDPSSTIEAQELAGKIGLTEQALQRVDSTIESIKAKRQELGDAPDLNIDISDEDKASLDVLNEKASQLSGSLAKIRLDPSSSIEAEKLAGEMEHSEQVIQRLKGEVDGLETELSDLGDAADMSKTIDRFNRTSESIRKIPEVIGRVVKGLSVVAAKAVQLFGKMATAAKNAGKFIVQGFGKAVSLVSKLAVAAAKGAKSLFSLRSGAKSTGDTFGKLGSGIAHTVNRIKNLVVAAFVFNILRRGFSDMAAYVKNLLTSNQQFVNSLAQVKANLQSAFTPIYQAILPALNAFMAALAKVMAYISGFISMIFGKTASATAAATEELKDNAKAIGGTGGAAKKAGKEMEKYLASFDEIQTIGSKETEDSGGGGSGGIGDVAAQVNDFFTQFESIPEAAYALGLKVANAINDMLSRIDWEKVFAIAETAGEAIAMFFNGIVDGLDWDLAGYSIAQGFNTILHFLNKLINTFKWKKAAKALAKGVNSIFKNIDWKLLGNVVKDGINGITDFIVTFFDGVNWGQAGKDLASSINAVIEGIDWGNLGRAFSAKWIALLDFVSGVAADLNWGRIGEGIGVALNSVFTDINFEKLTSFLADGLNGLFKTLDSFVSTFNWSDFTKNIANGINNFVSKVNFDDAANTLSALLNRMIDSAIGFFETMDWEKLGTKLGSSLQTFLSGVDLENAGKALGKAISSMAKTAHNFLGQINWKELGQKIAGSLNTFIETTNWDDVSKAISGAVKGALETAYTFLTTVDWTNLGKTIGDLLANFFSAENTNAFADTVIAFVSGLREALNAANENGQLTEAVTNVVNAIVKILKEAEWLELLVDVATVFLDAMARAIFSQMGDFGSAMYYLLTGNDMRTGMAMGGSSLGGELVTSMNDTIRALEPDVRASILSLKPGEFLIHENYIYGRDFASNLVQGTKDYFEKDGFKIGSETGKSLTSHIVEGIEGQIQFSQSMLNAAYESLQPGEHLIFDNYTIGKDSAGNMVIGLEEGALEGEDDVKAAVTELVDMGILKTLDDALDIGDTSNATKEYGTAAGQGVSEGMEGEIPNIEGSSKNMASAVKDTFASEMGIASPSKVTMEFGQNIVTGLIDGMENFYDKAVSSLKNFTPKIVNEFKTMLSQLTSAIGEATSNMVNTWTAALSQVVAAAQKAAAAVKAASSSSSTSGAGTTSASKGLQIATPTLAPYTFARVELPHLATGTVVPPNREFMAILGDNTREHEIVSPVSKIEEAVENVISRHGGLGGQTGPLTLYVMLDNDVLSRKIVDLSRKEESRRGSQLVPIAGL